MSEIFDDICRCGVICTCGGDWGEEYDLPDDEDWPTLPADRNPAKEPSNG